MSLAFHLKALEQVGINEGQPPKARLLSMVDVRGRLSSCCEITPKILFLDCKF